MTGVATHEALSLSFRRLTPVQYFRPNGLLQALPASTWVKIKGMFTSSHLSSDMDRHHCDPVVQVDVAQAIGRTSESHAHCVGSKANAARVESAGLLRQKSNTKGCWQLATIRLGRSRFYSCVGSFRFSFKIVCAARSGQIGLQNIVTVREH